MFERDRAREESGGKEIRAKEVAGRAEIETRREDDVGKRSGGREKEKERARASNSFSVRVLFVRKMEFHGKQRPL